MLRRLTTYYQYGSDLQKRAEAETDPEAKAALMEQSTRTFQRTVEIGNAMTNLFSANPDAFFYLSAAQAQLGDAAASEANFKTYQELSGE